MSSYGIKSWEVHNPFMYFELYAVVTKVSYLIRPISQTDVVQKHLQKPSIGKLM